MTTRDNGNNQKYCLGTNVRVENLENSRSSFVVEKVFMKFYTTDVVITENDADNIALSYRLLR